jgi:hypothetical protein
MYALPIRSGITNSGHLKIETRVIVTTDIGNAARHSICHTYHYATLCTSFFRDISKYYLVTQDLV